MIDDDESMREALARLLSAAGFVSTAFVSAEDFLASGEGGGTVCIVSDLKLPDASGLELLVAIRARGDRTPFILITAHDAPGQREEAIRRGAASYLVKPFRGTVLLENLRAAITPSVHS